MLDVKRDDVCVLVQGKRETGVLKGSECENKGLKYCQGKEFCTCPEAGRGG